MEKIIVFGNISYSEIANLWLSYIDKLGLLKNVIFIALDNEIVENIKNYEVQTIKAPYDIKTKGLNGFWQFRCEIFLRILDKYGSFIHSDLDAIWLKNPEIILKEINADLIFSQGTIHPRPMFKKFGLVACCGFFVIRDSDGARFFLNLLKSDVQNTGDDQVSVNKILYNFVESFSFEDNYYEKVCFSNGERFSIRCSNKNIFGDFKNFYDQKLSVAILPHRLIPRLKDSVDKSTIVAHPLAPKSNDEKMKLLKEIRLLS